MSERYFLDSDDCGHWFIVPLAKRDEWYAWTRLDEHDERSWEAPEWAKGVGGSPSRVTFENPVNGS